MQPLAKVEKFNGTYARMIASFGTVTTSEFPTISRCTRPPNRTRRLCSFTCSTTGRRAFGDAARWWLAQSLRALHRCTA
jgi:hypothetical protein